MSGFVVFLVWWRPELLTVYFVVRLERLSGRCWWEVGVLFPWRLSNRNLKLTSRFSVLPKLGMRGVAPSLPLASS